MMVSVEEYTALFLVFCSGACFGYAPAAASWIYVDYFIYTDGLNVGGFLSSLLVCMIIAQKGTYQCVVCFNYIILILWALAISTLQLFIPFVDFALGVFGGIATGTAFATIPWLFFQSSNNGRNLYFNLISPICFCTGVCTVYFCISLIIVRLALLTFMGIFFIFWITFVWWEDGSQGFQTQKENRHVLPTFQLKSEPTTENVTHDMVEKVSNSDLKPLGNGPLLLLLGLQPLSAILFLPLPQLICMNLTNTPWACYRNHTILQLVCVSIGSLYLQRCPRFSLLPVSGFVLAALYFMLAICSHESTENDTQKCNELSLGFAMFALALASSLGWYQLPFLISFELCRQHATLKRTGYFMAIWWICAYLVSLAIRLLSNELRLRVILTGLSILSIFLGTITSYLQVDGRDS